MNKHTQALSTLLLSTIITACGGGGGGGGGGDEGTTTEQVVENSGPNNTPNEAPAPAPEPNPTPAPELIPEPEADPVSNTATISLSWNAPTTRADNTALTANEIGGYEIYYYLDGTPIGDGEVATVNDGSTNYTTPALSAGTYHFAIATYDTNMVYSDLSTPVSATIE